MNELENLSNEQLEEFISEQLKKAVDDTFKLHSEVSRRNDIELLYEFYFAQVSANLEQLVRNFAMITAYDIEATKKSQVDEIAKGLHKRIVAAINNYCKQNKYSTRIDLDE